MSYSLSLARFSGKVAVVTGASSGIGKAIAEVLVKHGVIVAGIARRTERIEEHSKTLQAESGKLHAFKCDLTQQEQVLSAFKNITDQLGPITILVNNAGILYSTSIIDGDIEKWKPVLDVNVLAVAICIREAVKSMKSHNIKGHIININAILGHTIIDFPMVSLYPASKFALTALTETVRLEINREKLPIKITSLSPGYVESEFAEVAYGDAHEDVLGVRPGLVCQDVADAALYVLSTPDHVNVKELTVSIQGYLA